MQFGFCCYLLRDVAYLYLSDNLAEGRGEEVFRLLVPPGKDPPPLLGGQNLNGKASDDARPESLTVSSFSTFNALLFCDAYKFISSSGSYFAQCLDKN